MRIDVELGDLPILDALAFPITVVGFDVRDVGVSGGLDFLLNLLFGNPIGARLLVVGEGGNGRGKKIIDIVDVARIARMGVSLF